MADLGGTTAGTVDRRKSMLGGAMLGVGLMAAVDEIVFHQILAWHHFYDWSTTAVGLLSDGLLHTTELVLMVAGVFVLADVMRRQALGRRNATAGLLLGLGGFQVFDGLVVHKVLGLHQIRYGVELMPYDVAWNATGAVLLVLGLVMALRSRRERADAPT